MIKPLAKSALIHLGLTAEASAADAGMHKNVLGSGRPSSYVLRPPLHEVLRNDTILIISKMK